MKKTNRGATKITYLFVCGLVLLSFSLTGPGAQSTSEAAEVLNPLSPESKVTPQEPEAIPAPKPPLKSEELKKEPFKPVHKEEDKKEEKKKGKTRKKKIFFAPDTTVALENSQKVRILDGESSLTTSTGKVLSCMSGRLLFGTR